MKYKHIRLLFYVLFAIFLLFHAQTVYALAVQTYSNFAGVTDAKAKKDVWIVNITSWNGHIRSYTTNPVYNIGTIGWTWWTFRDTCNGVIVDNWVNGGHAAYGDSDEWDTGVDDRETCGNYLIWSLGKHDFKQGSSIWRPEFSTNEPG